MPVSACGKYDDFADAGYDSGRGAAKVVGMFAEGGKSVSVTVGCPYLAVQAQTNRHLTRWQAKLAMLRMDTDDSCLVRGLPWSTEEWMRHLNSL